MAESRLIALANYLGLSAKEVEVTSDERKFQDGIDIYYVLTIEEAYDFMHDAIDPQLLSIRLCDDHYFLIIQA